jgi:hypothetical protein
VTAGALGGASTAAGAVSAVGAAGAVTGGGSGATGTTAVEDEKAISRVCRAGAGGAPVALELPERAFAKSTAA